MPKISKKKAKEKKVIKKRSGKDGISEILRAVHNKFGKESIRYYGDQSIQQVEVIETGSFKLNQALMIGGVPRGRIVEVYGVESSGKTTLCLQILANAQKHGGTVAFIDVEHSLDPNLCKSVGINMDELVISQPDSAEEALGIVEMLSRSSEFDAIVIDSVSALVPQAEADGEIGETHIGLQARLMSQALRKLAGVAAKSNTCIIFINQIRQKIGVMFGPSETTTGGMALKFYASVRLEIRTKSKLKRGSGDDAEIVGNKVVIKVVKNKLAPPWKKIETELIFGRGFNIEGELIDIGMEADIVKRKGSTYYYDKQVLGNGKSKACTTLRDDEGLFSNLLGDIKLAIESGELEVWV